MKTLAKFMLLLILIGGGAGVWTYLQLPEWAIKSHTLAEPAVVRLQKGMRLPEFAVDLEQSGIIDSAWKFRLWMRFYQNYARFQAGQYRFEGSVTPTSVIETIQSGKVFEPFELQFVVPEGFTLKQVVERLEAHKAGTKAELWAIAKDKELLRKYNITGNNVEGFLFPATYSFEKMPSAVTVFEKMLETFFKNLPQGMEQRLQGVGLDLRKGVIFASLIQKETLHEEEMSKVSEVIWNRLHDNEALGIDAALIYGIEDYKGDITWKHLRDPGNPYNTRLHRGLPPGPIGAISMQALEAVFTPTKEGYKYYVLKNDHSSYHNFSRTLAEHNRFVKQLIQAPKKN
ncbi:MAG: endolytic transglycosylase MltG [Chitinophagaceae bacterium]|nr:endolytic transglycosylase MltG [Oligoflexus sp.]